jgi:hypothetical protein
MISELSLDAPRSVIVGCTGSGVIGPGWVSEAIRAMALMVVYGNGIATASISGINGENSLSLAKTCAEDLYSRSENPNMIIAFGPGLNVDGGPRGLGCGCCSRFCTENLHYGEKNE